MRDEQRPLYALAFDTSAYTTSVALVGSNGEIAFDGRTVLDVPEGKRGLRQSEALFQHVVNLPELMERAEPALRHNPPKVIAASTAPRNVRDSYMPVFRPGHMLARSLAIALGVPFRPISHQEGHLWAAFLSLRDTPPVGEPFLALQISGGTTEALVGHVRPDGRIELQIVGQTSDLTAGKFVDRIGVALGFSFPAGAAVEKCASRAQDNNDLAVRPAVKETEISFSGPLTALERQIDSTSPETIAHAAQSVLAQGLAQWSQHVVRHAFPSPPRRAYWVGGVAANQAVQDTAIRLLNQSGIDHVLFAKPKHSTDNALGVAYYAASQRD